MKRILIHVAIAFFVLIIGSVIIFYFWGSSATHIEKSGIIVKNYNDIPLGYLPDDTLCIVTYNIGYLSGMTNNLPIPPDKSSHINNNMKIQGSLTSLNPDFVAFQEIDFYSKRSFFINQFDSIGKFSKFYQGAYAINWDKNYVPFPYWPLNVQFGKVVSGQGILSKYPIVHNEIVVLPKPESNPFYYNAFYLDRLAQISKIDLGETTLHIVNVHLEAFDKDSRADQIELLIEMVQHDFIGKPFIILGDFNERPSYEKDLISSPILQFIQSTGLWPAISTERFNFNPSEYYTFDSENPFEKIDYIFYDPLTIEMISSEVLVITGGISDHLPVAMKFIIKKG